MAGSVGSGRDARGVSVSRSPGRLRSSSTRAHPAGCRTLFTRRAAQRNRWVYTETKALGNDLADAVSSALRSHEHLVVSDNLWGDTAATASRSRTSCSNCGGRPGCSRHARVMTTTARSRTRWQQRCDDRHRIQSQVAASGIGDGEFVSGPGEVFPFTFLRGFLGPHDMQHPEGRAPARG